MSGAAAETRAWPSRDEHGRTNQKVRRNSREAIPHEPAEFMSPRSRRERITAFRRHATLVRAPGKRRGADGTASYSAIAGDVLDYLMSFAVQTGRIFPAYEDIAEKVGCAYRTAVRVVRQLERGGWLSWERRFIRVGKPGTAEPQVEQTSNFYRLHLPNAAKALLDAWKARRPPAGPELTDEEQAAVDERRRQDDAISETEKRLAALRPFATAATSSQDREAIEKMTQALEERLDQLRRGIEARDEAAKASAKREFP